MSTKQTDISANKAKQLSEPKKHLFWLILPLPLMLGIGVLGNIQGWIGVESTTKQSNVSDFNLAPPEANVKELDEKKYSKRVDFTKDETHPDYQIGDYNSKILTGYDPESGIDENSIEDVNELKATLSVQDKPESPLPSQERKKKTAKQFTNDQQKYNKQVSNTLSEVYKEPAPRLRNTGLEDIDPVERERLKQNQQLLNMLEKQVQAQNQNTLGTQSGTGTPALIQNKPAEVISYQKNSDNKTDDEVFVVETASATRQITSSRGSTGNSFYGLNRTKQNVDRPKRVIGGIRAVIHGEGDGISVKSGTSVFIRLLEKTSINIGGEQLVLPANTLVSGVARITGDRVNITVSTIRIDNYLYNVNLTAYDLDGRPGLYVPDMQLKNQMNQSLVQSSGQMINPYYMMGGGSIHNQVGGQLAMQGINTISTAGRNIVRRKLAESKAYVKPNYQVILISSKDKVKEEDDRNTSEYLSSSEYSEY